MPLCLSYFPRGVDEDVLRNHMHYGRQYGYAHTWVEATHIGHPVFERVYKYDLILRHLRQLPENDWLFFIDGDTVIFRSVPIGPMLGHRDLLVAMGPQLDAFRPCPLSNMMVLRNTPANRAVLHALMTQACEVTTRQIARVDEEALLRPAGLLDCNAVLEGVYVSVSWRTGNWENANVFAIHLGPLPLLEADGRQHESFAHDRNMQAFLVRQVNGALLHGQPALRQAAYPALSEDAQTTINGGARIALVTLYTHHINSYARVAEHNMRRYCERHGYALHVYRAIPQALDPGINGTWVKTWLLQQHFADHDWVIWVDADMLFRNPSRRLEPLLDGRDLLLAKDLGAWPVNAGVLGFRRTPHNLLLLQEIWGRIEQVQDRSGTYTSMGDQFYVNEVLKEKGLVGEDNVYDHLSINTPPHLASDDTLLVHFVNLGEPYRSAYMADMDGWSMRGG